MASASTTPAQIAAPARDATGILLAFIAGAQILPGLLGFLAPGAFYDLLAPYPPENDHVLRDVGSWQIALGAAVLVAVRRPSWRVPMLAILTVQYALHSISHLIDVSDSDPAWIGPAELAALVAATLVLGAFFLRERARSR